MKCLFGHKWKFILLHEIDIYGDGWQMTKYPTAHKRIYEGSCERCGDVKVRTVKF